MKGWRLVAALSAAQLVSWGSVYYSFSLIAVPMERELGWSRTGLNGALSAGLLVAGVAAYPVGVWIDRGGGRVVMSLGSVLAAAALAAWSRVADLGLFYLLWFAIGLSLAGTLYEPVFAVLTRLYPRSYGVRITVLTLAGGFASTVFVPLTQLLIEALGWRDALLVLAACNAAICLPIHALGLRDRAPREAAPRPAAGPAGDTGGEPVRRALRHPVFWALAVAFTLYTAILSAITFHLIPLLTERGVPTATIVAAFAVFGPSQVAGRIALLAFRQRATAAFAGRLAFAAYPSAVALLLAFPASTVALFGFSMLFGAANGVLTIVRGTAVPELLWREGYGAINGALTFPVNLARGLAPYGAAAIWSAAGNYDEVLRAAILCGIVATLAFWYAAWPGDAKNH
ncbi:MAG TPA: MFS transporter [Stellaceae bacterium]|nr:MFS transporter [Stellaceae bacterium]